MIKDTYNGKPYSVSTKYVINRGTKGHRTLHIYNNPRCYPSRQKFMEYEEVDSLAEAKKTSPVPQLCKFCFPNQQWSE